MYCISSVCEMLMRLPKARSFLLWLRVRIRSVISTAWEWWWIMPCMKLMSASAGVRGRGAAVAGDNILLFCPGAPGCTMGTLPAEGAVSCPRCRAQEEDEGNRPNAKCHEQLYNLRFCRVNLSVT